MTYQSQLDKLMQMATIEQLKDLMRQFNNNISESEKEKEKSFSNQEILSLPIVQKVVFAYEEELKAAKNHLNQGHQHCSCHDNNKIFNRLDEQHKLFTDMFFKMEDKMNELSNDIHKLNIILNVSNQSSHFVATEPVISDHDVDSEPFVADASQAIDADEHVAAVSESIVADEHVVVEHVNIKLEIQEIVDNNLNQHIDEHEYIIVENNFDILEDDESVISEEVEAEDQGETDDEEADDEEADDEEADEEVDEEVDDEEEADDEETVEADELVETDVEAAEAVEETDEEAVEETDEEVATDDAELVGDEEVATDDAEDEEVFEIEIDDVTYFATDEENGILYEVTKTGEVGKKVGIIKDGEPIFS